VPASVLSGALPGRLSQTGLFVDGQTDTLSPKARAYEPAFALWSDGASKRRWIELPEGARIDTTDMDDWSFPVGTKLWKEFSLRGRRIETRLLVKVGPAASEWAGAAYVWDAYQLDATLAPEGVKNADGQGYEVPSAADCGGCHGGRKSHVLGFSAVQLAKPGLPLALEDLQREGLLTTAPVTRPSIPGDDVERAALGYLHANCGHCHNSARPPRGDGARCYDPQRRIDFWLPSGAEGDARELPAATTTVPRFVTPGEPDESRLIALVSRRGGLSYMPPLGSHRVDPDGVSQLRVWIEGLKRER
jgi:mono/diheme cytochrome c family protein